MENLNYKKEVEEMTDGEYTLLEVKKKITGKSKPRERIYLTVKHNVCGRIYETELSNWRHPRRCRACASKHGKQNIEKIKKINEEKRDTIENFKRYVEETTQGEYECISNTYVNNRTHVTIVHKKCGMPYEVTPSKFKGTKNRQGSRCPFCQNLRIESRHASILKQLFIKLKEETDLENRDCINPKTGCQMPTDIVNHSEKVAIEIQSWFHDTQEQKTKDEIKKRYWIDRGYNFYALDHRNYTVVEMIQIFFPTISEIPDWVDEDFNNQLDDKKVQELFDQGKTAMEIVDIMKVKYGAIRGAIDSKRVVLPNGYREKVWNIKPIVQLTLDGEFVSEYKSMREVEEKLGISEGTLWGALNKNRGNICNNFIWLFKEDYDAENYEILSKFNIINRPIVQLTLEGEYVEEYTSQTKASRITNIPQGSIGRVLRKERKQTHGFIWVFKDEYLNNDYTIEEISPYKKKPIVRIDKEDQQRVEKYNNMKEASEAMGIESEFIRRCLKGVLNSYKGYKWMFLSDYELLDK